MKVIPLNHLEGLIASRAFTPPPRSFTLGPCGRWRLVRWPIVALNTAILFTTPIDGAHYLINV